MRRFVALPLILLLSMPAVGQDFTILSPEQIGQVFCIARLGNDMAPVEALLTPELAEAIAAAETKNADWEKAHPGEKPPSATASRGRRRRLSSECTVGQTTPMMDEADVAIQYGFPEYPAGNFTDKLKLKLVPGRYGENVWRIDKSPSPTGTCGTTWFSPSISSDRPPRRAMRGNHASYVLNRTPNTLSKQSRNGGVLLLPPWRRRLPGRWHDHLPLGPAVPPSAGPFFSAGGCGPRSGVLTFLCTHRIAAILTAALLRGLTAGIFVLVDVD